jgi:hypothetical protein
MDTNLTSDTNLYYTNYYSKFINNKLHTEDVSQNVYNIKTYIKSNTYDYLKYKLYIEILKNIIFICCISLFGSILFHNGLISNNVYIIYLSLVFGIGFVFILYKLVDIYFRNNINFNEYDYERISNPNNNTNVMFTESSNAANYSQC